MRGSVWIVGVLAALPVLAGCLADKAPPTVPNVPFQFIDPLGDLGMKEHDHTDASQHQLAQNVSLVSHLPLTEEEGQTAQSHSIDRCDHWLVLGREEPGSYGVDIVDVADPGNPQWVGKYRDQNAVPGDRDVAWSGACEYVFMGNQGGSPDSSGVLIINAKDKAKPTYENRYQIQGLSVPLPVPNPTGCGLGVGSGVHTIYALSVGSDQFVYALNYGVHILKLATGADGKKTLELAGRYVAADPSQIQAVNENGFDCVATRRAIYGHDMTVYQDGARTIMYVAYAYDGLRIVDITDPATPKDIAHWVPTVTPGAPHYVHSVKAYTQPDGKRITVVGSETFEDRNTDTPSPIWILDTSNIAQPKILSTWVNPGRHGADHLLFSVHFFEIENQVLWLTHYHGGVWALDLRTPVTPAVLGYFLPAADTGYMPRADCCIGFKLGGIPMTFDIKVHDGIAYAADFATGLYALKLEAPPAQ